MNLNSVDVFLFLTAMFFSGLSYSAGQDSRECVLPVAFGWQEGIAPLPSQPDSVVPFSEEAVTFSENSAAISAVLSAILLSPASVTQGARVDLTLQIASCQENMQLDTNLPWYKNPTTLYIGQNALQYHKGAVIGNWLIFVGLAGTHMALAKYFDVASVRYPGALILPALFFIPTTTAAAVELLRFGEIQEIALGTASIGLQMLGIARLATFLGFSNFQADWDFTETKWVDKTDESYLKQYGLLFDSFREHRHWFVVVECLFSAASGTLAAYQGLQSTCLPLLGAAAAAYGSYASAILVLRPSRTTANQVYWATISSLQFFAILLNIIGAQTEYSYFREVGNGIIVATQWMITARAGLNGVYQLSAHGKSIFHDCCGSKARHVNEGDIQSRSLRESVNIFTENSALLFNSAIGLLEAKR